MATVKNNKKCIVCGEIYSYCPNCAEFSHMPRWHGNFHNENCKNLYDIACDFDADLISKEDALAKVMNCDLTYMENVHHAIAETIHKILE